MKNIKPQTKGELLLLAAVAFGIAACSGGGKKSNVTSVTEVTDNVVLDLPEDRALTNKENKKSSGSMFEVSTSESGNDVKAEKSTAVGSELLARMNVLATKEAGAEDVNANVEDFISGLLNKDIETARASFIAAEKDAGVRRETRVNDVITKFGGKSAVQLLTELKNGADLIVESKTKKSNELAASVDALDSRLRALFASKQNRANEVNELLAQEKVVKEKIKAVQASRGATAEVQKEIKKTEIQLIDAKIEALTKQISFLEADFNKAYQTRRDAFRSWGVLNNVWGVNGKTDAQIRDEVIKSDPMLQAQLSLSNTLKAKVDEAKKARVAKVAEVKVGAVQAMSTPADYQAELARINDALRAYTRTTTWMMPGNGYGSPSFTQQSSSTDLYLAEGKFLTKEQLDGEVDAVIAARSRDLEELRAMSDVGYVAVKKDNGKNDQKKSLEATAQRSAQFYREMIAKAFAAELKQFDDLQSELKKQDTLKGEEIQSAKAKFDETERYLREVSARVAGAMKIVAACQASVVADKEVSKRTLVDGISADVRRNLVTSLVTFQDYHQTETKGEFDDSATIAFENTNDFNRFVYLMLNDKNEVIGFQTASGLKAIEKKLKGTGVSHTEYRDPNDGEKPTFVKGEFEYTVNEFKSSFATPVSDLEGDAFSVAVCVQNKKGELEYKARKVLVNNTKAPASSADAPVADKK